MSDHFIYTKYTLLPELDQIHFHYQIEGDHPYQFVEKLQLEEHSLQAWPALGLAALPLIESVYLISGLSYYKAYLPERISCPAFVLSPSERALIEGCYLDGLGQYYVENALKLNQLHNLASIGQFRQYLQSALAGLESAVRPAVVAPALDSERYLVGFGGGKDSLVSLELLRSAGHQLDLFWKNNTVVLKPERFVHPGLKPLVEATALSLRVMERQLDGQLISEVNHDPDALNGHVPVAIQLVGLMALQAALDGSQNIVFSSEKSADDPSLVLDGVAINHQWSKSSAAEGLMRAVLQTDAGGLVTLHNPLRLHTELWITQELLKYPQYLPLFSSCNRNWVMTNQDQLTKSSWCGQCPKCAFVFLLLSAFLPYEQVEQITGNLWDNPDLEADFRGLLGLDPVKPFECVGTREEVRAALYLAVQLSGIVAPMQSRLWNQIEEPPEGYATLVERQLS